jgi:spermidine synthase
MPLATVRTLKPSFYLFFFFQLLLSFVIMLVPTTFMGATFPVVTKINAVSINELGNHVGNVYSINTIGSILGSFGSGFFLIPFIGVKGTTFAAAGLNFCISMTLIFISGSTIAKKWLTSGMVILLTISMLAVSTQPPAIAHNFYRIADYQSYDEYQAYTRSLRTVFFDDGLYGRVTVFEAPGGERSLVNDGKIEGSSTEYDRQAMSLFGLIPLMSAKDPKSALVIGLGTGYTALAVLESSNAQTDIAEINDAVLSASKYFVGDAIERSPRAKFCLNDARNYLYTADKKYDMVTSEPSYPVSTHVSSLFTEEFYKLVAKHLNKDGVYCQWIPRYIMRDDDMLMMFRTFTLVFPNTYIWGSNYGVSQAQDVMMIGVNGNAQLNVKEIDRKVREAGQGRLMLTNLDFSFYAYPSTVAKLIHGTLSDGSPIPLNTDDCPLLEFITPKNQIDFFRDSTRAFFSN